MKEQRIRGLLCRWNHCVCIIERTDKGQVFIFSQHVVWINNNDNRQSGRGQTSTVSVHQFFIEKLFSAGIFHSCCFAFDIPGKKKKTFSPPTPELIEPLLLIYWYKWIRTLLVSLSHDSMKLWRMFRPIFLRYLQIAIIFELLFILPVHRDWRFTRTVWAWALWLG